MAVLSVMLELASILAIALLLKWNEKSCYSKSIEQVIQQGKVIYLDEHAALITKDGSKIAIGDSAYPMFKDSDCVEGAVLVFAPRPESRLKAEDVSFSLVDFMVHELRTPLTVILSTSESLKRYRQKWTEEKQNNSLDRIQLAIRQMTRLLDDVIIWEQASTGTLTFSPELTDAIAYLKLFTALAM